MSKFLEPLKLLHIGVIVWDILYGGFVMFSSFFIQSTFWLIIGLLHICAAFILIYLYNDEYSEISKECEE